MIGRARIFAARLAARYRLARRWTPGAAFVYIRRAQLARSIVRGDTRIHFAPAIGVTLSALMPGPLRGGGAPGRTYYSRVLREERWAERVIFRYQRVEDAMPGRPTAAAASRGALRSPEMPRGFPIQPLALVRRKPIAGGSEEPAPAREALQPTRAIAAPTATTISPAEITRVTDQVMHTLDRRLAAFRERHGRS